MLYANDPYTAEVKHAMLVAARSVVLLICHPIPDPKEVAPFGRLDAVHRILTVEPLAPDVLQHVPPLCPVEVIAGESAMAGPGADRPRQGLSVPGSERAEPAAAAPVGWTR